MTTFKTVITGLLILNATSGIWSAMILIGNKDYIKASFSFSFSASCLVLFLSVMIDGKYDDVLMILLLASSLSLFTIDRIRGKNESLARKKKK